MFGWKRNRKGTSHSCVQMYNNNSSKIQLLPEDHRRRSSRVVRTPLIPLFSSFIGCCLPVALRPFCLPLRFHLLTEEVNMVDQLVKFLLLVCCHRSIHHTHSFHSVVLFHWTPKVHFVQISSSSVSQSCIAAKNASFSAGVAGLFSFSIGNHLLRILLRQCVCHQ